MLQQLLENILTDHCSQGRIGDLHYELADLWSVVAQLVNKFVRVDSSVVYDSLNLHADIVLSYDLLRRHGKDRGLHIHFNDAFAYWVN